MNRENVAVHLTKEEERALAGEQGESLATAYRILAAIGESTDAEKLIPVQWAHISGVNYNTIGDSGVSFLENLSKSGKFVTRTTINPMGYDPMKVDSSGLDDHFINRQSRIVEAYQKMGALKSFTCIPYEVFELPLEETEVSFAESNAAVYANSVANLRTNKESALSALASAITGKSPYSELRIEEMRNPNKCIMIKDGFDSDNELHYGLLGYFAGKVANNSISFEGIKLKAKRHAKALSAAIGTSGSCGMFRIGMCNGERIDFGKNEAKQMIDELNTSDDGDIITLGSPQLGVEDLSLLADLVEGKKFRKRCLVFCARPAYETAKQMGYAQKIESAGCELLCDCCTCLTPLINSQEVDGVITNSIKAAYYLNSSNKVGVNLKCLRDIVNLECR